jgi:glycerol-3-phosphate dehydrogenase (NAD(P)+)
LKLLVLGAGAWGTALAIHGAQRFEVGLWARDGAEIALMAAARCNEKYLPGRVFPSKLRTFSSLDEACAWSQDSDGALWVSAAPMAGLRDVAAVLSKYSAPSGFLWLCKGVEHTGKLPHEIVQEVWPSCPAYGALSGPSFADEVAAGLPAALTIATLDQALLALTTRAFHHSQIRIYGSQDLVGVELGGALKNVIAIATGVCDGLNLGLNARAALITRGLAEISRLGAAMGAQPETFMGLTGLGDLVLTCTGGLSRNRKVGLALAQGDSLPQILANLGHVAEGVACANSASDLADKYKVDMPILKAVNGMISGHIDARSAIAALVARKPKAELA